MDKISDLIVVAERFGSALGLESKTVSWRVFEDSKKLDALIAGGDIQTRRYARAMRWFSENWPADTDWPEGIARPAVQVADHDATLPAEVAGGSDKQPEFLSCDEPGSSEVAA